MPGSPVHTREITLDYSAAHMQCNLQHAPLRFLTSIQESAWITGRAHVNLPAVTLEYADPAIAWQNPTPTETTSFGASNLGWGKRYAYASTGPVDRTPTVEETYVDIDGDGLVDRLTNTSTETFNGECSATWGKNVNPPAGSSNVVFTGGGTISLPRLKWHGQPVQWSGPPPQDGGTTAEDDRGETCSLAGQVTAFWNSQGGSICHNGLPGGAACREATNLDDRTLYCDPNGRECPAASSVPVSEHTYLHYRWLDADGDGLTDLVAAVHGDVRTYDIEQGNYTISSPPQAEPLLFGLWPPCPNDIERCKDVSPECIQAAYGDLSQINACVEDAPAIPCNDLVKAPITGAPLMINRGPYTRCEGLYPWFIFKNLGQGQFDDPVIKYQPVPLESDQGDSSLGPTHGAISKYHAIMDFDGDGILDAIAKPRQSGSQLWWVWFGDGTGGFEPTRHMFFARPDGVLSQSGIVPLASVGATEGLFDINADGYPDHWLQMGTGNANVWLNIGTMHAGTGAYSIHTPSMGSWGVRPGNDTMHTIPSDGFRHVQPPGQPGEWTYFKGTTQAQARVFDVDGDGRLDVVYPSPLEGLPGLSLNLGGQFSSDLLSVI